MSLIPSRSIARTHTLVAESSDLLDALFAVPRLEPVRIARMTAQLCHPGFKFFEELDERTRGDRLRIRPAIIDLPVEVPTEPHEPDRNDEAAR